jgi:formylglycine-generating enzyme required for sulfatase activity
MSALFLLVSFYFIFLVNMKQKVLLIGFSLLTFLTVFSQSGDTTFRSHTQNIPGTTIQFKMVPIAAGNFSMGSNDQDKQRETDEGPSNTVSISAFWMGAYEVTFDEFNAFFLDESISQNSSVDAVTRPSSP